MRNTCTKRYLLFISLIIIILITYINSFAANSITRPKELFAPDTNFFNEDGNKVYLDQFEGKTVLLVFWATWCGTCISEMPSLDTLQKDFRKLPFEIIAVSQDFQGVKIIKNHFNLHNIRHLKIFHDYNNQLFRAMEVVGLPTAFLINSEGKIKIIFKGVIKWHDDEIRDMILSEIKGNPEKPKNTYISTSLNKQIAPLQKNEENKQEQPDQANNKEKTNDKEKKHETNSKK